RAALLGGALGVMYVLAKSTMFQRGLALAGVFVLALTVTSIAPDAVLHRYRSMFSSSEEQNLPRAAEGSSEARLVILKRSLIATITHPLLGVGFGQFGAANYGMQDDNGQRKDAQSTHNMY